MELVQFDEETKEKLRKGIPEEGSVNNPIDVLGDAPVQRYKETLDIVLKDDQVDSLIIMVCPTASADPDGIAAAILEEREKFGKPILVVNMGGPTFEAANHALRSHNVPTYVFPENAVDALAAMTTYAELERREADSCIDDLDNIDKKAVEEIFAKVKADGRDTLLGNEASQLAADMEFPVVLKIASDKILHKSDIGGVKVGIESEEEAKATFDEIIANAKKAHPDIVPDGVEVQKMMETGQEVIVGMIKDKQFGPMIAFGMGGIYVNLIEDVSFKLANGISSQEIDEQINDTKVSELLKGYRGEAPCDIDAVKEAIKRVARLTLDFPEISELDINPIFVYENGSSALDIKIKL